MTELIQCVTKFFDFFVLIMHLLFSLAFTALFKLSLHAFSIFLFKIEHASVDTTDNSLLFATQFRDAIIFLLFLKNMS